MSDIKVVSSKIVHKNPWYIVRKDQVLERLEEKTYFVVDTPGPSVFIVALTDKDEIYLIHQFRYPTNKWSWEIPGGNAGVEVPNDAAKRELQEETGFVAGNIIPIGQNQAMNGLASEIGNVFLARNLTQTNKNEQAEEGITKMKKFSIESILKMIKTGELTDGQSLSAIFQTLLHLGYTIKK